MNVLSNFIKFDIYILFHCDFSMCITRAIFYTCNKTVRGTLIRLTEFVNETLTKIVQSYVDDINTVRTKKVRKLLGQTEYIIQNYTHSHTRTRTRTRARTRAHTHTHTHTHTHI